VLGDEIRKARLAAGLSQEQLALRAGVDRTYVSMLERGLNSPTVDTLIALCGVMSVPASEIVARVEHGYRPRRKRRRN
jgi:transcriptional regulator with XRE-family HTH domain